MNYKIVNSGKLTLGGYTNLHAWVRKTLGRPRYCMKCMSTTAKKFEWANKSGKYKKDITDWIRLCTSCHKNLDKGIKNGDFCKRGHKRIPENQYIFPKSGFVACLPCKIFLLDKFRKEYKKKYGKTYYGKGK